MSSESHRPRPHLVENGAHHGGSQGAAGEGPEQRVLARRRIAIVGGAGFVGHHLALALAGHGARVHVIDALQTGHLLSVATQAADQRPNRDFHLSTLVGRLDLLRDAGVVLHTVDARSPEALRPIFTEWKPEIVVHLAGVGSPGLCEADPHAAFDHGLRTLESTLEAAGEHPIRFAYLSSSSVYAASSGKPVAEDQPLDPLGIDGAVKAAGEQLVRSWSARSQVPFTIVRSAPLYGPRSVGQGIVEQMMERALAQEPLQIEMDGRQPIDLTHVDDLVAGLCLALRSRASGGTTLNLSSGEARSLVELTRLIGEYFPGSHAEQLDDGSLHLPRATLDVSQAQEQLGFSPRYRLESGVPKLLRWYLACCGSEERRRTEPQAREPQPSSWSRVRPALAPFLR